MTIDRCVSQLYHTANPLQCLCITLPTHCSVSPARRVSCVADCLRYVAVCCSGMQCVSSMLHCMCRFVYSTTTDWYILLKCLASVSSRVCHRLLVGCSVLQCVAVCCSVVQCGAVWCSVVQCVAVWCSVVQCGAVCCSVLQCVAVCRVVCVIDCLRFDAV